VVSRRLIAASALVAAAPLLTAASLDIAIGKKLFERNWVSAPSSTKSDDGLGPLYDAPSCAACHAANPTAEVDDTSTPPGMVIRLGNANGTGDPVYGYQLQTRAVAGQIPEANPDIQWTVKGMLRTGTVTLYHAGYGPMAKDTRIGLRRAPSIKGVGLLAQIPQSEIERQAQAEQAHHDGVAGRVPWLGSGNQRLLGRFGWKATQPDLAAQTAMAFARDIGLSTRLHPEPWGDCTPLQRACRAGPHGAENGEPEVADVMLDMVVAYVGSLPPPVAAKKGPGEALFAQTGCTACHATLHLADGRPVPAYTDLLLHDLGPGLNDGIREGAAEPGVWRTAPLWDVAGSLKIGGLLHDGRARDVAEAVEWHAGEASFARARFRDLPSQDKAALVAFVSGL
jgi:CxxC motif-containing protein (DUF1111 family)